MKNENTPTLHLGRCYIGIYILYLYTYIIVPGIKRCNRLLNYVLASSNTIGDTLNFNQNFEAVYEGCVRYIIVLRKIKYNFFFLQSLFYV